MNPAQCSAGRQKRWPSSRCVNTLDTPVMSRTLRVSSFEPKPAKLPVPIPPEPASALALHVEHQPVGRNGVGTLAAVKRYNVAFAQANFKPP